MRHVQEATQNTTQLAWRKQCSQRKHRDPLRNNGARRGQTQKHTGRTKTTEARKTTTATGQSETRPHQLHSGAAQSPPPCRPKQVERTRTETATRPQRSRADTHTGGHTQQTESRPKSKHKRTETTPARSPAARNFPRLVSPAQVERTRNSSRHERLKPQTKTKRDHTSYAAVPHRISHALRPINEWKEPEQQQLQARGSHETPPNKPGQLNHTRTEQAQIQTKRNQPSYAAPPHGTALALQALPAKQVERTRTAATTSPQ
jgi:hypothetical protein